MTNQMLPKKLVENTLTVNESEMGPLVLTRRVELKKYDVLMEIGRQERREELQSILMLAEQLGGKVTPSDIIRELLTGRPESIGKAIIDRCQYLDLLDYRGRLTEVGQKALQTNNIFIPERGRYTLWYTEDPLILQKVLHIEPISESWLRDEVTSSRDRESTDNSNKETTENVRNELTSLEGESYKLMGKGGGEILIRKIEDNGVKLKLNQNDNLRLLLRISQNGNSQLSVSGKFQYTLKPPQLDFTSSWLSVLGSHAELWERDRNPPALRTKFRELDEKELTSFKKTVTLHQPIIPPYGNFETTIVEDVPIFPASHFDASEWVKWLLKRSIDTYLTEERYHDLENMCKKKFPDYGNLELPTRVDLALEFMKERDPVDRLPRQYWYLQAPIDLLPTNDTMRDNTQRSTW